MASEKRDVRNLRPKESEMTIILDDLDLTWHPRIIQQVVRRWNGGESMERIARSLAKERSGKDVADEVVLLLMHLRRRGKIRKDST